MKKLITILIAGTLLSSCEEKVSIYAYTDLEKKMMQASLKYDNLLESKQILKVQEEELEYYVADLENKVKEKRNSIRYAQTKVDALIKDYNRLVYEKHWKQIYGDIADDAKDVKSALEGSIYIARIRTKGGIRY